MDDHEQVRCRQAFATANASSALEGWEPTPADLALQARVIADELSFEDAVAEIIAHVQPTSWQSI